MTCDTHFVKNNNTDQSGSFKTYIAIYSHTVKLFSPAYMSMKGYMCKLQYLCPFSMRYTNLYNSIATNAERMEVQSSKYIYSVISSNQDIDVPLGARGRGSCFSVRSGGDITVEIEELLDHTQTQNGKKKELDEQVCEF